MLRSMLASSLALASASSTCGDVRSAFRNSECCPTLGGSPTKTTSYKVKQDTKRALLVIDTQYCFLNTSTTLPVDDAYKIVPILNQMRRADSDFFSMHVRSQDFHPANHVSFGPTFGLPGFYNYPTGIPMLCTDQTSPDACCPKLDAASCPGGGASGCPSYPDELIASNPACAYCFPDGPTATTTNPACTEINQAMWPIHCRSPYEGGDAGFPMEMEDRTDDLVLRKGQSPHMDAYSAFTDNAQMVVGGGMEAGFDFNLHEKFLAAGIEEVYVVGLAYDFCVAWSAKDAAGLGYRVTVVEDATAFIMQSTADSETAAMLALNVSIESSVTTRRRQLKERMQSEHARMLREAGVNVVQSKDVFEQMADMKK